MKKSWIFLVLLAFGFEAAANPIKQKNLETQIKEVTLYLSGAQVKRTGKTQLPKGETQLLVSGLSPDIDLNSVQVMMPESIKILSINKQYEAQYTEQQYRKRLQSLKDSMQLASDLVSQAKETLKRYEQERGLILRNEQRMGTNGGITIEELQKATAFYRIKLEELQSMIFNEEKNIRKLQKTLQQIGERYQTLNSKATRPAYQLLISVKAPAMTDISPEITYVVLKAGWAPKYEIRSKGVGKPIAFRYKAEVINNSRVDWDKVQLTLSTANPSESMQMPSLVPWTVDFFDGRMTKSSYELQVEQKQQSAANFMNQMMDQSRAAESDFDVREDSRAVNRSFSEIQISELSVTFQIEEPYTIPADNEYYLVDVNEYELEASFRYQTIPKLDRDAFLVADIVGWESLNLIEGEMSLYNEEDFAGNSYLNPRYANDTLSLSLGRDKKVLVKRNQVKDYTKKQFIGSNLKELKTIEITLRNTNQENARVTLKEQIPISKNSDIEISLEESSGASYDVERGELTWKLDLAPSETRKIRVSYTMKYPKNKRVSESGQYRATNMQRNQRKLYRR